ncbi:MFS transporter [Yimella lutea]|uniref:MFS transporter n=1 Tax=Yimella lutea TaxID=587872 RepID=UPI00114D837E
MGRRPSPLGRTRELLTDVPRLEAARRSALQRRYLATRGIAVVGSSTAEAVIPLVIVVTLGGGPGQISAVLFATLGTALVLRLPIARILDHRTDEASIQALALVLAGIGSALIWAAWMIGVLTYPFLLACVLLIALGRTVVSTSGYAVVGRIADGPERLRMTGHLSSVNSVGSVVGEAVGPALTRFVPPPVVLLVDVVLSVVSAICVRSLRRATGEAAKADEDVSSSDATSVWTSIRTNRPLLTIWMIGFVASVSAPAILVFLLDVLGIPMWLIGVTFAAAAPGGIVGGLLVRAVAGRFRASVVLATGAVMSALAIGLLLGANGLGHWALPAAIAYEFVTALFGTLMIASTMGRLQMITPSHRVARTMSAASIGLEAAALPGLLVGGTVGSTAGAEAALTAAVALYVLLAGVAVMWVRG